jgi:hypothetical protein
MALENADIERLKEIFVTRKECDRDMDGVKAKLSDDSARLAVIETQLKLILWVLAGVGGGIITMLVKMFFGS